MSEARDYGDPALRMAREEYYNWMDGQNGRYERINGVVVAMVPERGPFTLDRSLRSFDQVRRVFPPTLSAALSDCLA
ncbi:MAG TPA: hypothetical protein VH855_25370 [Acetobacteraceae bacterium]|jgi:hypothetical protein